jgi:RNA polymerase sigma-70 factor, ECF subfamily
MLALPPAAPASPGPLHAFADHFEYVCRALRRLGVVEANVEDLAQDVFLITCRRWADYRRDLPLRPWLAGIAFHVARKHLSRVWRETPSGDVELEDDNPQPDERLASERARALAIRCLASLAPRDRVVLSLHDIEGLPVRDVAEQLSVPIFTVYTRLRRARKRFALRVRELEAQPAGAERSRRRRRSVPVLLPALAASQGARGRGAPASPPAPPPPVWKVAAVSGASAAAAFALFVTLVHRPAAPQAAALSAAPVAGDDGAFADRAAAGARQRPVLVAPDRTGTGRSSRFARRGLAANAGRDLPALAPAAPSPFTASLTDGLAGYWRFDEGRGAAVSRDLSPAGRDCTLRAVDPERAWIEGSLGGAIDVGKGWIECPRPSQPARPDTELSVAAWVRITAVHSGHMAIASRQLGSGREDYFFLGLLGRSLRVRSSLWGVEIRGRSMPLGRWVHVAFTHAADGSTRLYQDGVEVASTPRSHQRAPVLVTTPLAIGAGINGPGDTRRAEQLSGAVDEVMVHDRALAPAEVAALAAGEQPPSAR